MKDSEIGGKHEVRPNTSVFHLETSNDYCRINEEQVMQTDKVLKCLSPLINSMRLFGLYFTRKPRVHSESEIEQPARRCGDWQVESTKQEQTTVSTVFSAVQKDKLRLRVGEMSLPRAGVRPEEE